MKCRSVLKTCLAPVIESGVKTFVWPSHSCTLAMSASFESAFVAAVARIECTQPPTASAVMPVAFAYRMTMLR